MRGCALPLTFDACSHRLLPYIERRWEPMPKRPLDLLQGTLDLLILKTLSWGPAHGYAIARWIGQLSAALLIVGEGSLYPALHRLQERGWVESEWKISDNNRRAKF